MCKITNISNQLSHKQTTRLNSLFDKQYEKLLNNDLNPDISTIAYTHKLLFDKASKGFGFNWDSINPNDPLYHTYGKVEKDLLLFSGLKNEKFIQEAQLIKQSLRDKSEKEIKIALKESWNKYYGVWLQTEMDHAQQTSYAKRRYQELFDEAQNGNFKYWRYNSFQDDRVRPEHRALNNVVKLFNDPFWNKYFPPNGYNCRCYVTTDFEIEEDAQDLTQEKLEEAEKATPNEFKKNLGKTQGIFTSKPSHPYISSADFNSNSPLNETILNSYITQLKGFYTPQGSSIKIHASYTPDYIKNDSGTLNSINQAQQLSEVYKDIRILPEINLSNAGYKNPDAIVNGTLSEFKRLDSINPKRLKEVISYASNQYAKQVIISLRDDFPKAEIIKELKRLEKHPKYAKRVIKIIIQFRNKQIYEWDRNNPDYTGLMPIN